MTVRPRVVLVDGVPMSGLVAEAAEAGSDVAAGAAPKAVVVALHGGASTAAYFDCPGHPQLSLLRIGAELGYTVVALDRPGYGSSAPYPDAMERPEQRLGLIFGALDKVLGTNPRGAGVFVVGHSAGCELAVRMAAEHSDIIGLELAGTGLTYGDAAREIMKTATATGRTTGLRQLLWEPADLYPSDVLSGMTNSTSGAAYEIQTTRDWPRREFPALAAKVTAPVQFTTAEHERVWRADAEAVAEIAAMFTGSPRFVHHEQVGAGHNLSLSVNAAAYHRKVLSFVEECVLARETDGVEAS